MYIIEPNSLDLSFPPVSEASPEGLLAIGGDLRPERLINAYRGGIFPWYSEKPPVLWWSPDPRTVLFLDELRVRRSLRKTLRKASIDVTLDQAFEQVITACAGIRRGESVAQTWITSEMHDAYVKLHRLGYAHSVETWIDGELVGGLYGVSCGPNFFGESMFSHATDASKIALVGLVCQLREWDFSLIDCQLPSDHLFSLGAREMSREAFIHALDEGRDVPDRTGSWELTADWRL